MKYPSAIPINILDTSAWTDINIHANMCLLPTIKQPTPNSFKFSETYFIQEKHATNELLTYKKSFQHQS